MLGVLMMSPLVILSLSVVAMAAEPVDWPTLSQYGALGVFVAVLLVGFRILLQTILSDKEKERLRAEAAEQALRESTKYIQEVVIPAAIHMTDASKDMSEAAKSMIELITQMRFEKRSLP